jgi:predicted transcriptional regulator of viral defense system
MNQAEALKRLRALGTPFCTTGDITAVLGLSPAAANMTAARLAKNGLVTHLARDRWAIGEKVNPLALPQQLAAPYPAYISLQTALFHHGMISQIPQVIYAVTVAKTRRCSTPLGVVSFHQVAPDFFFGYESTGSDGVQIATPEKALLDFLYLSPGRSRLFSRLPELELPRSFSRKKLRAMLDKIADPRRRRLVETAWGNLRPAIRN